MKKYEVMYILNASVEEEKRAALIEDLHAIITTNGGEILEVNEWGLRDFAYPIEHMTKGYYVVTTFNATNEGEQEFSRKMRINSNVVRFMVVKQDEE